MNLIKKAPLMAFVLGLGLMSSVITMSSFKASNKVVGQLYGFDQSIPPTSLRWVNIEGKIQDNDENDPAPDTYRCDPSQTVCTARFTIPPSSNSSTPDLGTTSLGTFSLN